MSAGFQLSLVLTPHFVNAIFSTNGIIPWSLEYSYPLFVFNHFFNASVCILKVSDQPSSNLGYIFSIALSLGNLLLSINCSQTNLVAFSCLAVSAALIVEPPVPEPLPNCMVKPDVSIFLESSFLRLAMLIFFSTALGIFTFEKFV